jgi:hypothetical protein
VCILVALLFLPRGLLYQLKSGDMLAEVVEKATKLRHLNDLRLRLWFPDDQVGKVIGKKGVVVQHISRETNTKLVMLPVNTNNSMGKEYPPEVVELLAAAGVKSPDELWTPATLSGTAANVLKAFDMLRSLIGDEIDDVVAEFWLHRAKHHVLHSIYDASNPQAHYNGIVIKKISADHNVRLYVPDGMRDNSPYVSVEGNIGNVVSALDVLMGIIHENLNIVPDVPPPPRQKKQLSASAADAERGPVILGRGAAKALNSAVANPGVGKLAPEKPKKKLMSTGSVMVQSEPTFSAASFRHLPLDSELCAPGASGAKSCEIMVDIPSKIIGLLLVKRNAVTNALNANKLSGNVLTQIQQCTGTLICMKNDKYMLKKREKVARRAADEARLKEKAEEAEAAARKIALQESKRLRKKQELHSGNKMAALVMDADPDSEAESEDDSDASDTDSDDETMVSARSGGYDSEGFADAREGDLANEAAGDSKPEVVQYRVRGAKLALVRAAVAYVGRIVAGESIMEVLEDVCNDPNCQYRPASERGPRADKPKGKGGKGKKDTEKGKEQEARADNSGRVVKMEKSDRAAKAAKAAVGGNGNVGSGDTRKVDETQRPEKKEKVAAPHSKRSEKPERGRGGAGRGGAEGRGGRGGGKSSRSEGLP